MAVWPLFCLRSLPLQGLDARGHPSSPVWESKAALKTKKSVWLEGWSLSSFLKGYVAFIALTLTGRPGSHFWSSAKVSGRQTSGRKALWGF